MSDTNQRRIIKRHITFRDKLAWKMDELKAAWNDDTYHENMGTVIDPLVDIMILLSGYIPPELRQKITMKNTFRVVHASLGVGIFLWVLWQGFGMSLGVIPTTHWEESHIFAATGIYMLKLLATLAFMLTSRDIRMWLDLKTK